MENSEESIEDAILTELSMDCRQSLDKIASKVGLTRDQVYGRVNKLVDKYGIRFVPEINIRNLQKYEYLGLSWGKSKKEVLAMLTGDENFSIGFEEYIALVEFRNGEPSDQEILKAAGGSCIPQYIARTTGQYNLFLYCVARNSREISRYIYKLMSNLKRFNGVVKLQFIHPTFGYFPLNDKFLEQMQIQASYRKLLLALNKNAKAEFTILTKEIENVSSATIGSIYARVKEIELLKRPTLFISKPSEMILKIFTCSVVNMQKASVNKNKWLLEFIGNKIKHYIFMCDIRNPDGALIIARFKSTLEAENFKRNFGNLDLGIEVSESIILKTIHGNLGIRSFAPKASEQYKFLEAQGIVHQETLPSKTESVFIEPL